MTSSQVAGASGPRGKDAHCTNITLSDRITFSNDRGQRLGCGFRNCPRGSRRTVATPDWIFRDNGAFFRSFSPFGKEASQAFLPAFDLFPNPRRALMKHVLSFHFGTSFPRCRPTAAYASYSRCNLRRAEAGHPLIATWRRKPHRLPLPRGSLGCVHSCPSLSVTGGNGLLGFFFFFFCDHLGSRLGPMGGERHIKKSGGLDVSEGAGHQRRTSMAGRERTHGRA